jgi:hypothetical protein
MPNGGGIVSTLSSVIGSQLQQHEYERYQDRMALVTDVGAVEELTDVARQVARQLADRYKEQLLRLQPRPEVPVVCCSCCYSCCVSCGCCKKDDSSVKPKSTKSIHPAEQVAQFGVVFAVRGIIHGELDNIEFSDDTKCEDLAKVLTKLICSAKPTNIKSKVLRLMNLDKNANLPYTPFENTKEGEKSSKWHLHDFYQKPGIWVDGGNGKECKQNPLSWMNPDLYGYRLGTLEEYNDLVKLDEKQAASNCCC